VRGARRSTKEWGLRLIARWVCRKIVSGLVAMLWMLNRASRLSSSKISDCAKNIIFMYRELQRQKFAKYETPAPRKSDKEDKQTPTE
jgi:hypothetical protein